MDPRRHHRSLVTGGLAFSAALPVWLMMLLLAIPAAFISTSVSRWLNSGTEESAPLTESEETCEEATVATGSCRVIHRGPLIEGRLQAHQKSGHGPRLAILRVVRGSEHVGRNGCGAVLRC